MVEYLYSVKDIAELLRAIRNYLRQYRVGVDHGIDYEKALLA